MNIAKESAPAARALPRRLRQIGIVALLLALTVVAIGIVSRVHNDSVSRSKSEADAIPSVNLVEPGHDDAHQDLVLPGDVKAYYDAPIYARVSGYLKMWYVDIGTQVKAGQLLAEIDSPELDQQLLQARADLATAEAKERLATITNKRWKDMLTSNSVSKQEADEKNGDYEAKAADTAAARANMERLLALASFKRILAPFDGVVTERKTDIGALINAGSGSGPELFRVADTHKLRVYVQVPQAYARQISKGMTAQLHLPEEPGRSYPATVVATSDAISEISRTLLVQLEADNARGELTAGSYADVRFDLPAIAGVMQLPVSALLFREHGLKVATLGPDNRVLLKSIQLGRDLGTRVEVMSGLSPSDHVIDSPPDWLAQGDSVRTAQPPPAAAKASGGKIVAKADVPAS
ncbi:MAG: efflux RND transporter periplasmic adaptor subunit [Rudaea sp.]|nr:efflux RND transporter periplasmic adaptor subunit [Rudaea sp.]